MRRINGLVLLLVLVLLMVVFVVSPAPLVISPTTTTTTSSSETPELDALAPSSLPSLPSYPLPSLVYDDVKKDGDVVEFLRGATTTAASPHQNDGLAGQVVEAIETKNAETLNRLFECPICLDSLSSDSLVKRTASLGGGWETVVTGEKFQN